MKINQTGIVYSSWSVHTTFLHIFQSYYIRLRRMKEKQMSFVRRLHAMAAENVIAERIESSWKKKVGYRIEKRRFVPAFSFALIYPCLYSHCNHYTGVIWFSGTLNCKCLCSRLRYKRCRNLCRTCVGFFLLLGWSEFK